MILLILGGLVLVFGPLTSVILMLYYSKKQDNDLSLFDEYEEKIRDTFTFGCVITPLIALFMIIMGVACLNI